MTRGKISPHFTAAEFDCRDGRPWPPAARFALQDLCLQVLEPLRAEFGPVRVTSGFRHATYNRSVGGAPQSFHRYDLRYGPTAERALGWGLAADVVPARGNPQQWASYLNGRRAKLTGPLRGRGAFVAYPRSGFVHVDTGPRRSWAG